MMFQKRCVVTESRDFSAFQTPLQPIPQRVEAAIALGVQSGKDFPFASAAKLLSEGGDGLVDAVVRNHDGVLVVACLTEMPGVTPQMWDWWFGWHGLSSERYRLWHPKEHLRSAMAENREHIRDARERYIGNTSYIEEYVGRESPTSCQLPFACLRNWGSTNPRWRPRGRRSAPGADFPTSLSRRPISSISFAGRPPVARC